MPVFAEVEKRDVSAMGPTECWIKRLGALAPLDDADRQALRALPSSDRLVDPGTHLVHEGDAPEAIAIIAEGFAFGYKTLAPASRQIVSLHMTGEALGLHCLFFDVSDYNIQALMRSRIAFVPRPALQQLSRERAAIGRAIIASTLVDTAISRQWLVNVGRRDSRARMAHFLCEVAVRINGPNFAGGAIFELPMTQEQVGDALALSPIHVNRTLRGLEKDGLLDRKGRRISFIDWNALRDIAGFTSDYLYLAADSAAQVPA